MGISLKCLSWVARRKYTIICPLCIFHPAFRAKHHPDLVLFVALLQSDTRSYKEYFTSLRAVFGPVLNSNKPLNLVVAQPVEACGQSSYLEESVLTNKADCVGKAVIINRGTCFFVDKVPRDATCVLFTCFEF
jgi:hypothetical protein